MRVCNATLEDLGIDEEAYLLGDRWTMHELLVTIAMSCAGIAILLSLFQIWSHATNYRRPTEQKWCGLSSPQAECHQLIQGQYHSHIIHDRVV